MDNQPEVNLAEEVVNSGEKPVDNDYSLILGVRRIKEGAFAGLWELTELTGEVSVKRVIMDASTRASIMGLAGKAIANAK